MQVKTGDLPEEAGAGTKYLYCPCHLRTLRLGYRERFFRQKANYTKKILLEF